MTTLKLFHHYSLVTSTTLAHSPDALGTIQFAVPSMAFTEPLLMHSMLAVASMHMHTLLNPIGISDEDYLGLSQRHRNQALSLTRNSLSPDTILLVMGHLMIYRFAEAFCTTNGPPAIFTLIATVRSALPNFDYVFREEQLLPLNWPHRTLDQLEEHIKSSPTHIPFPSLLHQIHLPSSAFPDPEEVSTPETSEVYHMAVEYLRYTWYMCQDPNASLGGAMSWLVRMSDDFYGFLTERRPRAMVILYHYCLILSQLKHYWWASGKDSLSWIAMMLDAQWMECILNPIGAGGIDASGYS
ncbi:hypothetical protein VNI00_000408 [Paramarasmius palmivorus]|uniref:Uncharacterized protein n=1 Tax=Paramarasmius palmivorus TaxID=297713 RepID=A0AAW0EFB8_9AGAR